MTGNEDFGVTFSPAGTQGVPAGARLQLALDDPRCRLCAAPFAGAGAPLARLIGKKASDRNPNWCGSCFSFM